VADLRGSYSGVMGLPLFETAELLALHGVPRWRSAAGGYDMSTEILINASIHEARAAVVENGVLQELFIERASRRGLISNIYKGRVSRVLPGMQAAFIEIGMERTAFLHASDIFDPRHADTGIEAPRTDNIRALVAEGNEILVQVVKDPLGTKGARLTTYITCRRAISCTCRRGQGVGVSARIEDESRTRPAAQRGAGRQSRPGRTRAIIVRTAAEDARSGSLAADMQYLRKLWEVVRHKGLRTQPGNLVHADLPLHLRVLRDLLRPDVDGCLIDQPSAHPRDAGIRRTFMPDALPRLELYAEGRPVFELHHVEEEIQKGLGPQGVAEIGRLRDHRSDRGDDHRRCQHGRLRRPSQSRGNHFSHQPRSGRDHRQATAPAQSGRHHHHRFHRHGRGGASPPGHPGAGEGARDDHVKTSISSVSPLGLVEMTRKRTRESLEHLLCQCLSYLRREGFRQNGGDGVL
jgi:ribonuclease G